MVGEILILLIYLNKSPLELQMCVCGVFIKQKAMLSEVIHTELKQYGYAIVSPVE